jgi:hypothetical protein
MLDRIPKAARYVTDELAGAFTKPTHARFVLLLLGAILTRGQHTVSNVLRVLEKLAVGHWSSYHRVLSKRRVWKWKLARIMARLVLEAFYPDPAQPIPCCGDDTVDGHAGAKVYGKGCHRDAARSSHSFTAYRWGHKWAVLAILVSAPWAKRPWALPVMVALYRPKKDDQQAGRRHKTPSELMQQMLRILIGWFPERKFVFSGDGGYGTHALARFAHRHAKRLTLVSRYYPDANLYALPSTPKGKRPGRPQKKGKKCPSPQQVVARTEKRQKLTVNWYGGQTKRLEVVSAIGHWYKGGQELVPIRWVYVHHLSGTHCDDYFFTTDVSLSAKEIIEIFTGRWSIEVTFEELRAHLGLETTRGRCRNTVLRAAPWLFGLYTIVTLLYHGLPQRWQRERGLEWIGKDTTTFSDVITAVRRWLWVEWVFETTCRTVGFTKLPLAFRRAVLAALTLAA